ncbi:RNA-dependent RNA polymerase [Datura stramonium]|uniref:RNA-dependent RNA polymerase n=1 Tax=Datura stramonium TaxID=4076 RepID=A0ABS8RPS2_DATST|nr:RNA-dependent RNA polymerase [Datura stramonium]
MSEDLAIEVAEKLQLSVNPPCAYQIRYAGCKGVVACWPAKNDGIRLSLRPSMKKFDSNHTIQKSALGRDYNLREMLSRLDKILVDSDVAFDIITASCAEAGNTAAIMLSAGYKPQSEPHLRGMLASIRAAQLGDLRNKARIFVPSGRRGIGHIQMKASGVSLDGDLYFVTWDENLIHPDIIEFFSKNMVQESLGEICNAHVVHADLSEFGALDEKCLKLAELAALAVDFPKTGKLVTMPFDLKPKMYPDFMGKEEFQSYKTIQAKLGRKSGYWLYMVHAEVHFKNKGSKEEERLKHAYNTLRNEFRNVFEHMEPDFDLLPDDEKNHMYERKASAWYRVTYHPSLE